MPLPNVHEAVLKTKARIAMAKKTGRQISPADLQAYIARTFPHLPPADKIALAKAVEDELTR